MYISTKVIDGFSTCFRQWRAVHSHCSMLHGYAIKFKIKFYAHYLDDKNWVQDFGFLKNSDFVFDGLPIGEWFKYMFDHTVVVASDDPELKEFRGLAHKNLIQLREVSNVGCEAFAALVFNVLDLMLQHEERKRSLQERANSSRRVRIYSVECIENEKNSAIYQKDFS